jgi:effector-binding domain-containing protein
VEHETEIKTLPPQPVLSIRDKVPMAELPAFIGASFSRLFTYLASLDEEPVGPPLAIYYSQPGEQGIDVQLCVPTGTEQPSTDGIESMSLVGGRFASMMHLGPYEGIGDSYQVLMRWIMDNCYLPAGAPREVYIVGVGQADPESYVTEILFPVNQM